MFACMSGETQSSYIDSYWQKMKTRTGPFQLKQLGFGPMETYKVVNAALVYSAYSYAGI